MNNIATTDPKEHSAKPPAVDSGMTFASEATESECPAERLADAIAEPTVHLVTVVGAAGIGKSHLVRQWTSRAAANENPKVTTLDCARYSTLDEAITAISEAAEPLTVSDRHEARDTVLILDDADPYANGVASLLDHLTSTRTRLTIVVTSRTSLDLNQEHLVRVSPLQMGLGRTPSVTAGGGSTSAVDLLIDGIAARGKPAAYTQTTLLLLEEIAQHCEGVPLALLLAASSICTIGAAGTLSKLRRGEELPPRRSTNVPERHSSMPRALEWSNHGLTPDEDTLLTRMSITAIPFGLWMATKVGGFDEARTTELLDNLVHRSLVECHTGWPDNPCYTIYRSVRLRHRARLNADVEHLRSTRTRFYNCLAYIAFEAITPHTEFRERRFVDAQLNAHFGAVDHFQARGDHKSAISILVAMEKLWTRTDRLECANGKIIRSLMALEDDPTTANAYSRGCEHSAKWSLLIGDPVVAEYFSREALVTVADSSMESTGSTAEALLGEALRINGDRAGACNLFTSSLAWCDDQPSDLRSIVETLLDIASIGVDDRLEDQVTKTAFDRVQSFGDPRTRSYGLRTLAELGIDRRDYVLAQRASLALLDVQLHYPSTVDIVQGFQAQQYVLMATGKASARSARRVREIVSTLQECSPIEWLVGSSSTLGFTSEKNNFLALDLRSMVEEVRAMPTVVSETASPLSTLTKRQLEIAQLVSDGLTNREIAKKLDLSEWTVVNHLRQVMSKLDCPSRLHVALVILGADYGDDRNTSGTG